MKTRVTKLLGIEHPIICGGMAWLGVRSLPAAVSNAGGLGLLGSGNMTADMLYEEAEAIKNLTDKPFGINLNRGSTTRDELLEAVCDIKPAIVTVGGGDPRPCIEPLKKAGVKVCPVVPSLRLAKRMEEMGCDMVVVSGMEGGGHIGKSTTMALLSTIGGQLNIPIVAAGGFASGKSMAAAMLLGAEGIQMGTAFLLTEESPMHPDVKKLMLEANDEATILTGWTRRRGQRVLRNEFSEKYYGMELAGVADEELDVFGTGAYRNGVINGDIPGGSLAAGIIVGTINKLTTCGELISRIVNECEETLKKAPSLVR